MKGKFFSRLIALVLALAMGFNTPVASASVEAKVANVEVKVVKGGSIKHASICKCPYCLMKLKKTGKLLHEGSEISKPKVKKVVKLIYNGKLSNNWTVKQKGNVVKYSKKGYKITIKKGNTQKSIYVAVNRMMRLYVKSCKQLPLMEGSNFSEADFRKTLDVWAQYRKGEDKSVTTYKVVASKKVTANSKGNFNITIKFGKLKDIIAIPVIRKSATPKPTIQPSMAPTPSASIEPTTSPIASPTVSPSIKPSTAPTPSATDSTSNPPIIIIVPTSNPTATPSVTPSASPTTSPTATPSVTPSASPTTSPTATPSVTPSASPTATPSVTPSATPEPKFHPVTLNGLEILRYTEGTMNKDGQFSENTRIWVKAIIPKGQNFANITNGKDEVITFEEVYDFRVKGEITLTANFSRVPVVKEPIVHFTRDKDPLFDLFPDLRTVRLYISIEIPDGYEKMEYGFVYATNELPDDQMIIGVAKKVVDISSVTTGSADFTFDARFKPEAWDAGEYRYFRPYGIVRDSNGNVRTIYGSSILAVHLSMSAT